MPTASESAILKMALKNDPETPDLAALAERWPLEAAEAIRECEDGADVAAPDSWVGRRMTGAAVHPGQGSLL